MSSAVPPWNGSPATLPASPPMNTRAVCEWPAASATLIEAVASGNFSELTRSPSPIRLYPPTRRNRSSCAHGLLVGIVVLLIVPVGILVVGHFAVHLCFQQGRADVVDADTAVLAGTRDGGQVQPKLGCQCPGCRRRV